MLHCSAVTVSPSGPAGLFKGMTTATSGVLARFHFVPWHRGSGCLGAAAPVTGAAADEYNLNVVDCNASVTVARRSRSSISVSGGLGGTVTPRASGRQRCVCLLLQDQYSVFSNVSITKEREMVFRVGNFFLFWEFYGKRSFSVTTPCASPTRVDTERLAERETLLHRLGSKLNRIVSNSCGNPIIRSGNNT